MKFSELVKEYSKRLAIDDRLNEDGSIDITFGEEITLNFHLKGNNKVIVMALLDTKGALSTDYDLQYLMRVHLSRIRIDDSILSIDSDTNELLLYDVINISEITLKNFEEKVGLFLNAVRFWRNILSAHSETSDYSAMRFFP